MIKYLKSILIILIFLILNFVFVWFLKKDFKNSVETIYKIETDNEVILNENEFFVYLYDELNNITKAIKINKTDKNDQILNIINIILYGYNDISGLKENIKFINYKLENEEIYLYFDLLDINQKKQMYFLEELYLSFKEIGINKVYLKLKNEICKMIGNYYILNGLDNKYMTNIFYLNSDIKNYKGIRVFKYENDILNINNYIIDKSDSTINFILDIFNKEYPYLKVEVNFDKIKLNISPKTDDNIKNNIIFSITKTIKFNSNNINIDII